MFAYFLPIRVPDRRRIMRLRALPSYPLVLKLLSRVWRLRRKTVTEAGPPAALRLGKQRT